MDTGTGIAVCGVWSIVGAALLSRTVTSVGVWVAVLIAMAMTVFLTR